MSPDHIEALHICICVYPGTYKLISIFIYAAEAASTDPLNSTVSLSQYMIFSIRFPFSKKPLTTPYHLAVKGFELQLFIYNLLDCSHCHIFSRSGKIFLEVSCTI